MSDTSGRHRWKAMAGYVAWLTSGLPVLVEILFPTGSRFVERSFGRSTLAAWVAAYVGFACLYTLFVRHEDRAQGLRAKRVLVAAEAVLALAVARLVPFAFGGVLLVVVASQLATVAPIGWVVLWTAVQSIAFGFLMRAPWGTNAVLASIAYFSFGLFAIFVENARMSEELAKEELACANAELHATQALLIDGSRGAERLRIARELHDLLGHHLTALSLNLEVASHLTSEEARPHVEKSQQLTRLLLGDVRAVVSELRQDGCFDLARALRTLTHEMPAPRVHLDVPDELCIDDPVRAHILLRGAQEILTNCARHSGAENLWLGLLRNGDGIALTARDDGRGAPSIKPGNGLNGIRERVEAAGGRLEVDGASGGFKLEVWLPLEGASA
jgi:signal transduction histidine kinase